MVINVQYEGMPDPAVSILQLLTPSPSTLTEKKVFAFAFLELWSEIRID